MRARLTKDFTFEAAQTLPNAPANHKCRKMHGHSFKIEVSVEGEINPRTGWLYDHAEISAAMKPLLQMLDHSYLNDIDGLVTVVSAAELPELRYFQTKVVHRPDLVVEIGVVGGLRPRFQGALERNGESLVYREHLGGLAGNFKVELGEDVR